MVMTYARDPLSARFDGAAAEMIGRAIRFPGKTVLGTIDSPAGDPVDEGGLTRHERAFQRALYHDARIRKPRKSSAGEWSMPAPDWLPRTGRTRLVRIRVFSDTSAAYHASARTPRSEQWSRNAALQSGGVGSPKQRFG